MTVYTLLRNGDSDEYHLFVGELNETVKPNTCSISLKSICKKMDKGERSKGIDGKVTTPAFACQKEAAARTQCATRGRSVCGVCVSSLYRTSD